MALDYLGEMVAKLNDNPGLFETYQKKLREMFQELANNHFVMSNAIETIFEQVRNFTISIHPSKHLFFSQ